MAAKGERYEKFPRGEAFAPSKRKCRKNPRGILKGPGPQARSLKAAFFPRVSLQKQRNPEKILINDLTKLHSDIFVSKTLFFEASSQKTRNPEKILINDLTKLHSDTLMSKTNLIHSPQTSYSTAP